MVSFIFCSFMVFKKWRLNINRARVTSVITKVSNAKSQTSRSGLSEIGFTDWDKCIRVFAITQRSVLVSNGGKDSDKNLQ